MLRRIVPALISLSLSLITPVKADNLVEPAVFASAGGLLDLLIIAKPKPVPTISFTPPGGGTPINPTAWVYEVCARSGSSLSCPVGSGTVADYGGVRLQLQQGDTLKIRLVNRLPAVDELKVAFASDPGGANLPLSPTNLHTHGLIVPARAPTRADPTYGDYIYVSIFNPANGMPAPEGTHRHGDVKLDFADYRIAIPADHPSGLFWFHPHIHGLTLNQLTTGLAGVITIGNPSDYLSRPPSTVRHLILKDMQVVAAGSYDVGAGPVDFADGEIQAQESGDFCEPYGDKGPPASRQGLCEGAPAEIQGGNNYTGGRWYYPVNGQIYPTVHVAAPDGELWRLTNASGQITYRLSLTDPTTKTPMAMQLVSIDGVSIQVPPTATAGTIIKQGGNRFALATCPSSGTSFPICVSSITMMPSSRAEVVITYRNSSGQAVVPPAGASANLQQDSLDLGPAGEVWPQIKLANVLFEQTSVSSAVAMANGAARSNVTTSVQPPVAPSVATPAVANCQPLAAGHRRRIFYGVENPFDENTAFGLGYEEIDANGVPVIGTQVPVTAFDPAITRVCVPLGANGAPVTEEWELISLATEIHNFHIHQTKFTVLDADALGDSSTSATIAQPMIVEDNVPIPYSSSTNSDIANLQNGYCTIDQWRSGVCVAKRVVVRIPFSQLGDFAYHCHISAHSDGGMMAKIRVVSNPSFAFSVTPHDFNGDAKSDVLWRYSSGSVQMWLMNGGSAISNVSLGNVGTNWSIVGQRDFNGDGKSDILWRNSAGDLAMSLMNGTMVSQVASLGNIGTNWSVVGTGDFNADGKGDILWRDTSGNMALSLMNGASVSQVKSLGNVSLNWNVAGVADFNGDGTADILWRDTSGSIAIWLMDGTTLAQVASLGNFGTDWSPVGTADFNGDSKSDILWRNSAGDLAMWLMNGTTVLQLAGLGSVSPAWLVASNGDYNGDGRGDILWRSKTGDIAMWTMNGISASQVLNLGNVATSWTIQNANAN